MDTDSGRLGLYVLIGVWLIPLVLAVRSRRVVGSHKWLWILLILTTSWFGWVFFSIVAKRYPLKEQP